MSLMDACIRAVMDAGGGHVSREDAAAMLDAVDERAQRLARDEGLSHVEAAARAAKEMATAEAVTAAVARRNALLNLTARVTRRQRMMDTAARVGGSETPDLAHAVTNQIVARNTPAPGNRASAEAQWRSRSAEYGSALALALQKSGLATVFRRGTIERDWARELYELSARAAGRPDQVGRTGNAAALKIAEAIHGLQQLARERLNRQGAWIGNYAGYITRTAHDADTIRRAGFPAWRAFIEPRLAEETFDGVGNRTAYLQRAYNALSTGVHMADREAVGWKDPAFSGPGNMADRASASRTLHWRNADAWLDYQQQFGRGTLPEQLMGGLDRAARQEALMSRWGTNPEAEFQQDLRWLAERYRDNAPDAVAKLRASEPGIRTRFDYLTGEASRPANQMVAEIGAGIRAVQSMAKLGGVAFTHLSAFATGAAEMRYHGVGWLESYGNAIKSLLTGRGSGETRDLSDLLLAGMEGAHHNMMARFSADDAVSGTMAKAANNFFKMSGLTYLVDAEKAGKMRLMSRWLGQHLDSDFDALPPELARTLTSYDITPAEWDALREAPGHAEVDGRAHLTPDAAHHASDEAITASLGKIKLPDSARPLMKATPKDMTAAMLAGARDRLAMKVHTLFDDIASRSIIAPGIDEKAMFLGGARAGTLAGEALRFVAQFKLWGAAAIRQGLGRELYGGQGAAGAASGMIQLALGAATMGYVTMTLKDVFKGKTPRNPTDPRTVMAALIQGGGYGILGDYLFGEFGRFGQTPVESLAGPSAGTLSDILGTISTARGVVTRDPNAHAKDFGPEALRIVQNNTPFLNLFYSRKILDYLLFHSLQESMNPGYLRRAERRVQRQTGQGYYTLPGVNFSMSPQNHLHTFGR